MPLCACDLTCATHESLDVRYVHHIYVCVCSAYKSCVLKFSIQHDTHITKVGCVVVVTCSL